MNKVMNAYVITYNPSNVSKGEPFFDKFVVPNFGGGAMLHDCVYIVTSDLSSEEVLHMLSVYTEHDEGLLVMQLGARISAKGYPKGLFEWFENNLKKQ